MLEHLFDQFGCCSSLHPSSTKINTSFHSLLSACVCFSNIRMLPLLCVIVLTDYVRTEATV